MRRPFRTSLALACAVMASTVAVAAPRPEPTRALTSSIWLDRAPNSQRIAGAALSSNGSIGFVASTHSQGNTQWARVWRSMDGGSSWYISGDIPQGSWESIAVSGDGQTVVALGTTAGTSARTVMVSVDGGEVWSDRTPAGSLTMNDVDITSDASHIALATTTGVRISSDDGVTWANGPSEHTFPSDSVSTPLSLSRITIGKSAGNLVIHAVHNQSWVISWVISSLTGTPSSAFELGSLTDLAASDDGSVVLASSGGSSSGANLHLSRTSGATWATSLQATQTNSFVSVAVSGDGTRRIAAGYSNPILESTGTDVSTWSAVDGAGSNPWMSLALSSTGSRLLGGTERSSGASVRLQIPTPGPTLVTLTYGGLESSERLFVPATGGGQLDINGENFYDVTSVSIGDVDVAGFDHQSPELITLEVPPAASPGRADVVVTTAHGTSTLVDVIDYYPLVAPSVTSTSVSTGSFLGGTRVTFTGEGLREVNEVLVDGRQAQIGYQSPIELEIVTPATRVGLVDISITSPRGTAILTDGWTSTWEAHAIEPSWSSIDGGSSSPLDMGGYPPHVSRIIPDGNNGFYIVGRFDDLDEQRAADHVAHWNGSAWSSLGETDNGSGILGAEASNGPFGQRGVDTAVIDNAGQLWVGGTFELDGETANIARFDPVTETWWVPNDTPDDRVTSIAPVGSDVVVAGDFGPLPGVPESSRLARLSPTGTGTWTGIGSDGSGGPAISGDGTLDSDPVRSIQAVQTGPNGSLTIGGVFRLPTTTTGHDLIAQFNGTSWQSVLRSNGNEIVTSLDRGVIDGIDTIVAGVCSQQASGGGFNFDRGRVVSIVAGVPTTVGTFDDCVRDVAVVGNGIVAVGWFMSRIHRTGNVRMDRIALLHNHQWTSLAARSHLESVTVLDGYHLAVSNDQFDDRIGPQEGTEYMARIGSLRDYVTDMAPLVISEVTSTSEGDSLTVTVTGTGFTESTEVTLDGRPANNLVVASDTSLRFTTTPSTSNRTIGVYGRSAMVTATLSPPLSPAVDTTTTTTTKQPVDLPTSSVIDTFPMVNLLPTGTPLYPGASFNVTAGGFVAGEEVWFLVASTPRRLGQGIVAADGTITANVTLPGDLVGSHTLVVWSPTTGRGVRQPITIAANAPSAKIRIGITKTVPNLLKSLQIPVAKRSKFAVTVKTKKLCALTPKKAVRGLSKGNCRLAVKIIPPKGKASTKIITVTITPRSQPTVTPPGRRRS